MTLESEESFVVRAPREKVWAYTSNMRNWASNMPGYQSFEQLSDTDSRWTLQLKLGPFKRTVRMLVHLTEWDEPEHVAFTLHSETDPVNGSGGFRATETSATETAVTLHLRIDSSGPMAGMMESLAKPVLERMQKSFADAIAADIERSSV
ncbi:MAG TPA: SRPBCC family protein [Nitrolancea sp.]|nr:SRPBCC family protein [Nitrolancea sp.]